MNVEVTLLEEYYLCEIENNFPNKKDVLSIRYKLTETYHLPTR